MGGTEEFGLSFIGRTMKVGIVLGNCTGHGFLAVVAVKKAGECMGAGILGSRTAVSLLNFSGVQKFLGRDDRKMGTWDFHPIFFGNRSSAVYFIADGFLFSLNHGSCTDFIGQYGGNAAGLPKSVIMQTGMMVRQTFLLLVGGRIGNTFGI